jgi:hypothetical protein
VDEGGLKLILLLMALSMQELQTYLEGELPPLAELLK